MIKPTITTARIDSDTLSVTRDNEIIGYIVNRPGTALFYPRILNAQGWYENLDGDYYSVKAAALALHKATK